MKQCKQDGEKGPMGDSMDRSLGQLEGSVAALIKNVETQREESARSRAGMYEKLDTIQRALDELGGRVTRTEQQQARSEATTAFVESIKQRAIGIALAVSFAFAMLGAGFVLGVQRIAKFLAAP